MKFCSMAVKSLYKLNGQFGSETKATNGNRNRHQTNGRRSSPFSHDKFSHLRSSPSQSDATGGSAKIFRSSNENL